MRYRLFAVLAFLSIFTTRVFAQIPQMTLETQPPQPGSGHDYIQNLNETVNPSNGQVTLKFNIPMPKGRQLSIPFYAVYNSGQAFNGLTDWYVTDFKPFNPNMQGGSYWSGAGWSYTVPAITSVGGTYNDPNWGTCGYNTDYIYDDASGNATTLSIAAADDSNEACGAGGYYTIPNAQNGTLLSSTNAGGTVTDADGTTFNGFQMEDRNGNIINFLSSVYNQLSYVDTMGRTVLSLLGFGSGTTTITSSKFSNPYTLTWGSSFPYNYSLHLTLDTLHSYNCGTSGYDQTTQGSIPGVSSLALPNGQSYTFAYDPTYGRISKITYPSGAYVRYVWGIRQNIEEAGYPGDDNGTYYQCVYYYGQPVVTDRYVSPDGVTETEHQAFSYGAYFPSYGVPSTTMVDTDLTTGQTIKTVTYNYTLAGGDFVPFDSNTYGTPTFNESSIVTQSGSSTLRTVNKLWYGSGEPEIGSERTTLEDGSTATETYYCYNGFFQVIEKDEFNFTGTGSPGTTCNSTSAPGPLIRKTITSYASFGYSSGWGNTWQWNGQWITDRPSSVITYDGSGNSVAETDYTYGNTTSPVTVITGTHDDTSYGSTSTLNRGNTLSATKQCFPSCSNATTSFTYDDTGQVLTQTDPDSHPATLYSYTDCFASGTGSPSGATDGYLTQITDAIGHTENFCYGYNDGTLRSSTDQNSQVTSYTYGDSMDRLTTINYPDTGETQFSYNDAAPMSTTVTKTISGSLNLVQTTVLDGFGREVQTQLNSDPSGVTYTATQYDGMGRKYKVWNPTRCSTPTTNCGESTWGYTTYNYDSLNRPTTVTKQDGSAVQTSYNLNSTTVTDEAGKTRQSFTDCVGRLTQVIENPGGLNYTTNYTYNALDDLLSVVQGGSHNRTFVYDSLKRLTSSTNPEPGSVTYSYDPNGNVLTKTDARSLTITYAYDALNRMTGRTYSNSEPSVSYTYDGSTCIGTSPCYNIGRRTGMTDAGGSETFSYDTMGREWGEQRTTNGITKTTGYTYNLDGSMATLVYPSGRTITYAPNAAAQPVSAEDTAYGINYATIAEYAPTGALSSLMSGSNLIGTFYYNSRQQACRIAFNSSGTAPGSCTDSSNTGNILDLTYNFNLGAGDNGNVMGIANNRDTTRSQVFSYDTLNRIFAAGTNSTSGSNCWGEQYTYDAWANLTSIASQSAYSGCTQESGMSIAMATAGNNQVSSFSYDNSGNVLSDSVNSYAWNAESEMKTGGGVNYTYDGDGNRVEKSNGTIYWYGAGSEILDESDASGNLTNEYVYFGGKRIATRTVSSGNIYYYAEDFLGSSRTMVQAGATSPCYDADFYPYGGERDVVSSCNPVFKFEGKERDAETQNDDFGARYYSWRFGRWESPDWSSIPAPVPYANLNNPQTLNLYAMVSDNPETFADLDGHCAKFLLLLCSSFADDDAKTQQATEHPQNQQQNPPQNGNKSQTVHRVALAIRGIADVYIGQKKLGAAAAAALSTEATGAAGVAGAAYGTIGGGGQVIQGTVEIAGAMTGDTKKSEHFADEISSHTSILGIITLIRTHGDVGAGAAAANWEQLGTSGFTHRVFEEGLENVLSTFDLVNPGNKSGSQ